MNKVILLGRVGKDPEVRKFDNGGQVVSFSLATTARWRNKEGEKQERTEWHNVIVNGKLSEIAEKYIAKGSQVLIEGEIRYREYEKEGVKKYITEIFCTSLELLGSKESGTKPQNTKSEEVHDSIEVNTSNDNDLPF